MVPAMTILEALNSVPHRPYCYGGRGECTCDRRERIAGGVEAAMDAAHRNGEANGSADSWGAMIDTGLAIRDGLPSVVAAFVRASGIPKP